MMSLRRIWRVLKETFAEWQFNEVSLLASSLAYYTVFSLAPLMVIVITILGAIYGEATAKQQTIEQLQEIVGQQGAQLLATAITNMREDTRGGVFRLIFNFGFFAFGASGVFAQIQYALDKIWEVKPEPKRQIFHFIRKRILSFAMVLVMAFLLFVSYIISNTLVVIVNYLSGLLPGLSYLWQFLSFLLSFGILTLLFAAIYTILPDAQVAWRSTLVGAAITSILFMIGQFLFGLFLSQIDIGSAYGVAGSFIIIITWIYYAAHILFLGAEFTKVYAKMQGSPIVPEDYAVRVERKK
ncbi:YihY/virulence factor BrkB family protein [Plectonema cf. radiosum LEGE 06105]|uniref:YihY/virulence factor BrkB family protein n=1 Tax=Plectonema cf. radiosum LEGE 06105 TaxID=945769 RepID=A0A8J7F9D5_9CYAN|nr:YihY/virulence factor BrkB family protein [Plectonema radiosum]MBE9211958.1 YihY/virulence factor BrkB family protein [Plectonema cf. radiosum LEGE 06105]